MGELREEVKRLQGEGERLAVQFEETCEEFLPDEDCKMEVDSEADSRKKLDQRKREIAKQLRKVQEFTTDLGCWNDLLLGHEKMQNKFRKLQSLQDKLLCSVGKRKETW